MMSDLEDGRLPPALNVDLCLIGAGPAGIVLAEEMRDLGLSVCLMEGGGHTEERRGKALFDGESIGHEMIVRHGRHRGFGGSAQHWGGRMAPLSPIDLEQRPWIAHSGWPIAYADLGPFYERAKQASNFAAPWLGDSESLASVGRTLPPIASEDVVPFVWHYAPDQGGATPGARFRLGKRRNFDWGKAHLDRFRAARDIHLIVHANLVQLVPASEGDRIEEARFRSLNRREIAVKARAFVTCCGGLETPRILLHLDESLENGLHGRANLGRFFMQHPRGTILEIAANREQASRLAGSFGAFPRRAHGKLQYEIGFALSETAQRRHGLLNASASLYFMPGETSAWEAAKRLRGAMRGANALAVRDVGHVAQGVFTAWPQLWGRFVSGAPSIARGGAAQILVDLEQMPSRDSRLSLSQSRDALGIRRLVVDWRLSSAERRTSRFFADAIAAEIVRLGLGEPRLPLWLHDDAAAGPPALSGNYHFIGAARMAASTADGVVDADARVFGQDNLFVTGSAIFPTGGHANPTLTILALAIRLADHLKHKLAGK
jgi:choline dehydrogenase-like flavoprotein